MSDDVKTDEIEAGRLKKLKLVRVSPKEVELTVVLAMARYLSERQVQELGLWASEESLHQRLMTLAGKGVRANPEVVYLTREDLPLANGRTETVWGLTDLGYRLAATQQVLVQPRQAVGEAFLRHEVELNEVLVALLLAGIQGQLGTKGHARTALGLPLKGDRFRWVASSGVGFPWHQYQREEGRLEDKVIKPDATLEIPGRRQRLFLELEQGTHTIVPVHPSSKPGATINKVERYRSFCSKVANPTTKETFYQQAFPDGFSPRLVFLVHSEARRDHVRKAIDALPRLVGGRELSVEVYDRKEACRLLVDEVYGEGTAARGEDRSISVSRPTQADLNVLARFCFEAYGIIQKERRRVRAENQRQGTRLPELPYPENASQVVDLLRRLGYWRPQ